MLQTPKKQIKYDASLSNFVAWYFLIQALNLYVKNVLGDFLGWGLISKGILALLLLLAVPAICKRAWIIALFSEGILMILFCVTLLSETAELAELTGVMFNSLMVYLPLGICVSGMHDTGVLLKKMYLFSWPTQIILIATIINVGSTEYSMSCGYALLLQMLVALDHFLAEKRWYDLLIAVADGLLILLFGSRGPLLCIAVYVAIRILFSHGVSRRKRVLFVAGVLALLALFDLFYLEAAEFLMGALNQMGYESRSLQLILQNSLASHTSGRDVIFRQYWELMLERPWFGWGLAGGWKNGVYPHNIVLEFLLSFGILGGSVLSVCLAAVLIRGLRLKELASRRLAHILITMMVGLLVSGSFIMDQTFFMCIAVCTTRETVMREQRQAVF